MNIISNLYPESEQYFLQIKQDRETTQKAYKHLLSTLDSTLATQDLSALLSLIPYLEEGEGYSALQYLCQTHQFLRILRIIDLECKFQKVPFCWDCTNAVSLQEKYQLTLFAFRRLLFRPSELSVSEATHYLQNRPISHFAAYIILQQEQILPNETLYELVASLYSEIWSKEDTQQFFSLISNI